MRARIVCGIALAVLTALTGAASAADRGWTRTLHSQHGLRIPRVYVTAHDDGTNPGFIFVSPRTIYPGRTGPLILDSQGRVVWFHPQSYQRSSADFHPQVYRGKPVLSWAVRPPLVTEANQYKSTPHNTYHVIADDSYHIFKRLRAIGRGLITDIHDMVITRRNTALILAFRSIPRRLAAYHGPRRGLLLDSLVQELDIRTHRVLFTWSAARHIPLRESIGPMTPPAPWDAYHFNSVSEDSDGNLLVSSRHTSTIYKVDRRSGRIIWRLGGRNSSFRMGRGTRFYYQHDAEREPDGTITLLDNHATDLDKSRGRESRVLRLRLDMKRMTASLARVFRHPSGGLATSQGNARDLPNGNVFVGWGISPWFSEYAPDGRLLFAAHFSSVWHHSYRAFKAPWSGRPGGAPAVAASTRGGRLVAYVSWNGATDVARWRVLGGTTGASLQPLGDAPWADFETKISLPVTPPFIQVQAIGAAGNVLAGSAVIEPKR